MYENNNCKQYAIARVSGGANGHGGANQNRKDPPFQRNQEETKSSVTGKSFQSIVLTNEFWQTDNQNFRCSSHFIKKGETRRLQSKLLFTKRDKSRLQFEIFPNDLKQTNIDAATRKTNSSSTITDCIITDYHEPSRVADTKLKGDHLATTVILKYQLLKS